METYKWALILDRFPGVLPRDLAEMTDWQIERLYLYPRDAEGKLKEPVTREEQPLSVEAHIAAYRAVADATNQVQPGAFSPEVIAAAVEQIRRHHDTGGGPDGGERRRQ